MKRFLTVLAATVLVFGVSYDAQTRSSGAPAGSSGAPPEGGATCSASSCHLGNPVNSGSGGITVAGPKTYQPGQTVSLAITVAQDGAQRVGFEVSAIESNSGSHVGTLKLADSNTKFAENNPSYITHTNAPFGSSATFTIEWQAPPASVGLVTFYIAGNAANGNGSQTGDNIYTAQYPLAESGVSVEGSPIPSHFAVTDAYPNPVADQALIGVQLPSTESLSVRVLDLLGRPVVESRFASLAAGSHQLPVSVSRLSAGPYLVVVQTATGYLATRHLTVTR